MADMKLPVVINDADWTATERGFLKKCPMPQIEDPAKPGQMIDEFPTTEAWMIEWLEQDLLKAANHGIDDIQKESGVKLTKAIFKQ